MSRQRLQKLFKKQLDSKLKEKSENLNDLSVDSSQNDSHHKDNLKLKDLKLSSSREDKHLERRRRKLNDNEDNSLFTSHLRDDEQKNKLGRKRKDQYNLDKDDYEKDFKENEEREAKEREAREREAKEREVREREAKEREAKEREAKEREAREREAREREAREREAKEREVREREAREREAKEREAREREAREREAKEREVRETKNRQVKEEYEKEEQSETETDYSDVSEDEEENSINFFETINKTSFLKLIKKSGPTSVANDTVDELKDVLQDFIDYMFDILASKDDILDSNDIREYMELYLEDIESELPEVTLLPRDQFEKAVQQLSERSHIKIRRDAVYMVQLFSECILMKVVEGANLVADASRRSRISGKDIETSYKIYML